MFEGSVVGDQKKEMLDDEEFWSIKEQWTRPWFLQWRSGRK